MREADLSGLDVDELRRFVERLDAERGQLAHALESRIVIEQAKGVLAERYRLSVGDAFLLLRKSARSARVRIHDLAADVVRDPTTPQAVLRGMASDSRLRAIAMRERTELSAQTNEQVRAASAEQFDRITQWTQWPTARVRVTSRSDAVDLAARLGGYRWYLIVPDEENWEVVVEFAGPPAALPPELREKIVDWLTARGLPSAQVRLGETELSLAAS
jgi:hypothetical protein